MKIRSTLALAGVGLVALLSAPAAAWAQAPAARTDSSTDPPPPPTAPPGAAAEGSLQNLSPAPPAKDQSQAEAAPKKKEESTLPFRGSTFLFDQSMTTQTAHLDTSPQQSYVPLYEMWFSLRPRWYFTDKLYAWARLDLTKELTNSQETNKYREDVFGDIWLNLIYKTPVPAISKNTKMSAGVRALLPTSKESQANGTYVNPGVLAGIEQTIPINGDGAKFLNEARLGLSAVYNHPFTRATTAADPTLNYERESIDGRTFVSDQVTGLPLVNHQITAIVDTGVQITPKIGLTLDMIFFDQWHYAPKDDISVPVSGGTVFIPRSSNDTLFTQKTWFIASLDYAIVDEITLGLGYYNLANVLAPDSVRRGIVGGDNIWWSPVARVFFDVTLNIDKFYEWASGAKTTTEVPLGQPHQTTAERNERRIIQSF